LVDKIVILHPESFAIVKTKYDVYDAVKNALELINYEVNPGAKILIKPNILRGTGRLDFNKILIGNRFDQFKDPFGFLSA